MTQLSVVSHTDILYRAWEAASPKAVVLLVHGLGAHSERWQELAQFLLKENISSYAIELKGFGETKTVSGHIDSFQIYYNDLNTLTQYIREKVTNTKLIIVGESLGGLIAFAQTLKFQNKYDGLICLSPAFANQMKFSFLAYISIFWDLIVNPWRTIKMPFQADMLSKDTAVQQRLKDDSRESRAVSAKMLLNILFAQIFTIHRAAKIRVPTLFLLSGKDQLVKTSVSKKVFKKIRIQKKKQCVYENMLHALSLADGRIEVFKEISSFIKHL